MKKRTYQDLSISDMEFRNWKALVDYRMRPKYKLLFYEVT
jgi:hypothetical protein